jgi:ribosomal protein S18 acetylase RimI-like enzyme
MIIEGTNLTKEQLLEVNNLMNICEKYDNAKTCIQMNHSLNYFHELNSWNLYYNNNELIGILSIFSPMRNEAEISICISPSKRKKGVAKELLKIAYKNLEKYNIENVLIVCDRNSQNGIEIIKQKNLYIHHSEYTMKYTTIANENSNQRITVKTADVTDMKKIINVNMDAFGETFEETESFIKSSMQSETRKAYIGIYNNNIIGAAFVGFDENISINTVCILKEEQNKGYGKELLNGIISQLNDNSRGIFIDVDSTNINAYKLYKSIGFKEIMIVDYYKMA